jgi:hypothetical protein
VNRTAATGEDLGVGALAGYLGTKIMEPVSQKLYELEPAQARAHEDAARPGGSPYRIAAAQTAKLFGLDLSQKQLDWAGLLFHYGLAVSWAPLYALLRRTTPMRPVTAGLTLGTAMSLIVDEAITPPVVSTDCDARDHCASSG